MIGFIVEIILVSMLIVCCFVFIIKRTRYDDDNLSNPSMELSFDFIFLMICIIILICIILRGTL